MVGKTDTEIAQMSNSLMENLRTFEPETPPQPAQIHTQRMDGVMEANKHNLSAAMPNPDLALTDANEYNRQLQVYLDNRDNALADKISQQMSQSLSPVYQQQGMMARDTIARNPKYSDLFARFGHEIDQALVNNNVPLANRTPQMYEMVADMVKGKHFDELAREQHDQLLAKGGGLGTISSGAGSPTGEPDGGDALDQFWETDHKYIRTMKGEGLTKTDLRKSIAAQNHKVDAWVKLITGTEVFVAPDGGRLQTRNINQNV